MADIRKYFGQSVGYIVVVVSHCRLLFYKVSNYLKNKERKSRNFFSLRVYFVQALQHDLWLVDKLELAGGYVGVGEHNY